MTRYHDRFLAYCASKGLDVDRDDLKAGIDYIAWVREHASEFEKQAGVRAAKARDEFTQYLWERAAEEMPC